MKHYTHIYSDLSELETFITHVYALHPNTESHSLLIQIYGAVTPFDLEPITLCIHQLLPEAILCGASSVGEIADGETLSNRIVILMTVFEDTKLFTAACHIDSSNELTQAERLFQSIQTYPDIRAALILATPTQINLARFLHQFRDISQIPAIFGAGAASSRLLPQAWVLLNQHFITAGVVTIIMSGSSLQVQIEMSGGWVPLGKPMTFTQVNDLAVHTIDNLPAQQVYEHYIGPVSHHEFPVIGAIFSFLIKRNGHQLPRTTTRKDTEQKLHFLADIYQGETFQIGVGDPYQMHLETNQVLRNLEQFNPDTVFLYSCGVRRLLMQDVAHIETEAFRNLGPCGGFYTYGEIYSDESHSQLFNGTLVAVGLKEAQLKVTEDNEPIRSIQTPNLDAFDPYAKQHSKIISRMLNLTRAITADLEVSNKALFERSITDNLTQLHNRGELDRLLFKEIERSKRYVLPLSIIMIDLDNFKRINDQFGHLAGDQVLINVAQILRNTIRSTDEIGRWGGEEFLVITPQTNICDAGALAEKLRMTLEKDQLPGMSRQTASFGVAELQGDDRLDSLLHRADDALYHAKWAGKNLVCLADDSNLKPDYLRLLQLTWQPEFESGNEFIDRQHQNLFYSANKLIGTILKSDPSEDIALVMKALTQEIIDHLDSEELFLKNLNYPDLKIHQESHNVLRTTLTHKITLFQEGKITSEQFLEFIIHIVIRQHMLDADHQFFDFLHTVQKDNS